MHRTDNHVTTFRCKDLMATLTKRRIELVAEAGRLGLEVKSDKGLHFFAEGFDASKRRIVFHTGEQGAPFANGRSITCSYGAQEYSELFLPKAAA